MSKIELFRFTIQTIKRMADYSKHYLVIKNEGAFEYEKYLTDIDGNKNEISLEDKGIQILRDIVEVYYRYNKIGVL